MGYQSQFDGNKFQDNTFTQLTAPGVTTSIGTTGLRNHSFQVTIAAIDTNVVVQIEGSNDGTSFGIVQAVTAGTGISLTNSVATITANATYILTPKNAAIKNLRFRFVSESGGTAATIDVVYHGSN